MSISENQTPAVVAAEYERRAKKRFFAKVSRQVNGCWLWTAAISSSGYGSFRSGGKSHGAHRWAYLSVNGSIGEGLQLDHLCRNRKCVNPDHLEPVTSRENTLRGVGQSAKNAMKLHCSCGAEYYTDGSGRRRCRLCRNAGRRALYAKGINS